jgi:hypothetical protein
MANRTADAGWRGNLVKVPGTCGLGAAHLTVHTISGEDIVAPGGIIANVGVHGVRVDFHLERLWAQNIAITTRLVDYDSNKACFRGPDLSEPAHILFKARRDDSDAYSKAEAQAAAVLSDLQEHPDRFDGLARRVCPIARPQRRGRLGQVVRGETTPEFETFLVAMEPRQLCPAPVRMCYGVHVLRLHRRIEGKTLPFDAVQIPVAAYLEERTWRRAVAQYIALVVGQARIGGSDLPAATSPLVQ